MRLFYSILLSLLLAISYSQTTLINPTQEGGFELAGGFSGNGWTVVNSTVNTWQTSGVAVPFAGSKSAFISADGGTTYSYNNTTTQTSHIYRAVSAPSGQSLINLKFQCKSFGETFFDRLLVYVAPTTIVPVVDNPVSSNDQLTGATLVYTHPGQLSAYSEVNVTLPSSLAGTTFNLIFTWQNDNTSPGVTTPTSIDNVSLVSSNIQPLNGVYTINNTLQTSTNLPVSGSNFASFSDAINYLNSNGISGAVTFNVSANQTFNESTLILIASGTSTNTITFQKSGAGNNPLFISANGVGSSDAAFTINGGDYITFDGIDVSFGNEQNVNSQIENAFLIKNFSSTNGAKFNQIKNLTISLDELNYASVGLAQLINDQPSDISGANTQNQYSNLFIKSAFRGIYLNGSSTVNDEQNKVENCYLGTNNDYKIGFTSAQDNVVGIWLRFQKDFKISKCTVSGLASRISVIGILIEEANGISDVNNNKVNNLLYTNLTSGVNPATGIRANVSNSGSHTVRIFNNFISGISSSYTGSTTTVRGIRGINTQFGGNGASTSVFEVSYNTVVIDGSSSVNLSNTCFETGTSTTGPQVKVRNNIFMNATANQINTARHFCYRTTSPSIIGSAGSVSDFNDYFISNFGNGFVGSGSTTSFYSNLQAWKTAYNQDANSLDVDPIFEQANDFHVLNSLLNSTASTTADLSYISTDLDNDNRLIPSDIGADEFTPVIFDLQLVKLLSPDSIGCFTNNEPVKAVVRNRTGGDLDFTANPVNLIANVSGASNQNIFFPLNTNSFNDGLPLGPFAYDTIPLGFLDLSAFGTHNIKVYSSWNADQNRNNDTISNYQLTNAQPVAVPIVVGFNAYNGTNLSAVFPGWRESSGATSTNNTIVWDDWNDFGFVGNKNARVTLNGNSTQAWLISPKFTPNQYSILSYKVAVTQPLSITGLPGTFGADDEFYLKISTDCGETFNNIDTLTATDLTNSFTQFYYPLDTYNGQQIIIAFFASDGTVIDGDCDLHIDDINISALPSLDVSLVQQPQPANSTCFTANESIALTLKNTGPLDINFVDFPANLKTIVSGIINSTYTATINTGILLKDSSITVSLANGLNLTQPGQYYFTSTVLLGVDGDVNAANDTLRRLVNSQNPSVSFPSNSLTLCNGDSVLLQPQVSIFGNGGTNNLTFTSNDSIAIPDSDPNGITSTIAVSGLSGFATQLVSVTIDSLIHTYDGDLVISLMAPDSSLMILSQSNGSAGDNYISTVFTPNATNQIQFGTAPFTGNYRPQESFDSLTGPSNGNWRLIVSDVSGGDIGTLFKWSITFNEPNVLASYQYSPSTSLTQSDSLNYLAYPSSAQVYTLTVTDARACSASATVTLNVNQPAPLNIGTDTIICEGTPLVLDAGVGFNSYSWNTGDNSQQITPTITNVYMVEVVDSNACSNRDTVTVIIYPNPTIELGNDTTIPFGTTIILAPGFGYQSYAWSNGSSADYIEVGLPGTFTVSVTDYNGCVSRDTVIISMPSYIDLALIHFAQPVEQSCYGANENLIVTVKNTGNRVHDFTINPINIESTVTGPTPQNYSLQINSDSLMPDSSRNYLITSILKLSRPGAYNISSQIVPLIPDSNTINDFISLQINSTNPEITISTVSSTICVGDSVNVIASASVSGLTQPASFESNTQVNIPDNDPVGTNSSISISGVSFNANEIVSITIDSIIHPSVGDLILTLIAPNGSQTFLSINNGNGANYIATRFTSSATSSITTSNAPFTGDFLPQSPFTSLTGNASGNWTLLVKDVSDQNTTTGIFYGWKLEFPQQNYVTSNVWTPASSVNGASTLTPALYPATTTQYTLTVTDANGCSSIDSLLVDVGTCNAINELNEKESGLSIFPNPTSDLVNVLINDSNFSLVLMDALGKELLKSSNLNHKTVINLQNVEPGIYFIYLINSNKQIIIKKIIKN